MLVYYRYTAYGEFTAHSSITGVDPATLRNPFTYRGYYYDYDLGLYYLNSRYYDANTCRFINADSALYHNMLGYNMFAYCYNNPVNYIDYTGENADAAIMTSLSTWWLMLVDGPIPIGDIAYAVILVVSVVVICVSIPNDLENGYSGDETVESFQSSSVNEANDQSSEDEKSKDEVDPHRRPGQKKQNRSLKSKSRRSPSFKDRSNKRHGRPTPKKHTPGRSHQKYGKHFSAFDTIEIFRSKLL